jgi:hypothetical protein
MNARRRGRSFVLGPTLLLLVSCSAWSGSAALESQVGSAARPPAEQVAAARHVDRAVLMSDVTTLASREFEGRRSGTAGGFKAREWISRQFKAIGLTPGVGSAFTQPFTLPDRGGRGTSRGALSGTDYQPANIVGRISGSDAQATTIVITAHYDHVGIREGVIYHGADDNASGVAALLAVARQFVKSRPRHPMVFAALDAEESGQQGAQALISSNLLPRGRTALNINLDMLSRSDSNEIYAAGPYYSPWQTPILQDVQTRASVRILFGHDRPGKADGGLEDWTHSSDHGAFHDAGVPFVYFGVEDHADYHKPTDTADKIDPRFFGDVVDMIVEAVRAFDARMK